ncbi:endoglucanase V-like protein [Russula ochroleuca]|uniref:Endoglucanase V-like protein n=1 Tax=Russula ochroleuca TaxID=152965 RepID=A0A9P5T8A1_9AGAM|nr:endoglucanase V-like protein [Russula ochroleuca]
MKSSLALAIIFVPLSTLVVASPNGIVHRGCDDGAANNSKNKCGDWVQKPKGQASFTSAEDCVLAPSCGQNFTSGFTAAVNELAFGSNHSFGDACGRCFKITPTKDPFSPKFTGPFGNHIIVKVNNLCLPHNDSGNASQPNWCGQTVSNPLNTFNMSMHFDLCAPSGASAAFFPPPRLAMLGKFQEVSCNEWKGSQGNPVWNGSCMAPANAPFWPATSCGNEGCPPP